MRPSPYTGVAFGALVGLAAFVAVSPSEGPVLRTVADVPLPGPAVRFDYQGLDQDADRLYIAHMNADKLVVFDVKARRVVADLAGFDNIHGVIAVPAVGRVYATVTGRHHVAVVDSKTLAVLARVGDIVYPDGLAYASEVDRVFVSDEHGAADVVIDAKTNQQLSSIPLGGEAGNTLRVLETHKLADGPDVLAFDPGWRRLYVASESGGVSVFTETRSGSPGGKRLVRDGDISMPHAHTVAVDPRSHLVYFPLENLDGRPVLRIMSSTAPKELPR